MGATLMDCPNYGWPKAWISGIGEGDDCDQKNYCQGLGRVCRFILEHRKKLKIPADGE